MSKYNFSTLEQKMLFGKYKGKSIYWIMLNDLGYIDWLIEKGHKFVPPILGIINNHRYLSI